MSFKVFWRRQSEIHLNKPESLLWGQRHLADFPEGNSLARPSARLASVHVSLKGDLSPFSAGFLPAAFASPEVSVDDRAVRKGREKSSSQEWTQRKINQIPFECKEDVPRAFH